MNNWKKLFLSLTFVGLILPMTSISAAAEKPAGSENLVPIREIAVKNGAEGILATKNGTNHNTKK